MDSQSIAVFLRQSSLRVIGGLRSPMGDRPIGKDGKSLTRRQTARPPARRGAQ